MNDTSLKTFIKAANRYYLKPGYVYVCETPSAIQTVLGSCVGVCIFDRRKRYGGMNHFMLPQPLGERPTTKFGSAAMYALYRAFIDFGSNPADLEAQIYGGSGMPGNAQSKAIGAENILIARKFLTRHDIPIVSEDVAGTLGRKILFLTSLNRALVYKLADIRRADYFNYRDPRRELHD
jgi:chemotaxis protein CheD